MKPEEKAKELFNKFWIKEGNNLPKVLPSHAKACAIICVDEILELPTVWFDPSASLEKDQSDTVEYWEQVKTSISNL